MVWTAFAWFRIGAELNIKDLKLHKVTHLPLREPQVGCQLGLASDGDVPTVVEFLLQLQPLMVAVHDPVLVLGPRLACNRTSVTSRSQHE
jgi:hypothetical protein